MLFITKGKRVKLLFFALFLSFFFTSVTNKVQAYDVPIGIPDPGWGIDEVVPDRPSLWDTEIAGHYFVNYETGTDTGRTYGTPTTPRKTIPSPIPAGARVEVAGEYNHVFSGNTFVSADGTTQNPSWLVGIDGVSPVFTGRAYFHGTYLYVDGINLTGGGGIRAAGYTANHIMIRNSNITALDKTGFLLTGTSDLKINNIVLIGNIIHDTSPNWNDASGEDVDCHGIGAGNYLQSIWILDNTFYHIGGNAIQIGGATSGLENVEFVYFGGNTVYKTRQAGVGIKKSSDIVISSNNISDTHHEYGMQNGNYPAGIGYQYAPQRLWIINNTVFDADNGIIGGGTTTPVGDNVYIIGNMVYNIDNPEARDDHFSPWAQGAAIRGIGAANVHVVGNTVFDAEHGITGGGNTHILNIENNIVSNVTYYSTIFETSFTAENSSFSHNNFYQPEVGEKLLIGSTPYTTVTYPGGDGTSFAADPLFIDVSVNNFNLRTDSPVKEAGILSDVYATFQTLYGLDISKDLSGTPRPQNSRWDIGAYEYMESTSFRADVDGSLEITTTDALLTLRNSLGLSMNGTAWRASAATGDVNCDGVSNSTDALLILRHSLGLSMDGTSWCE